MSSTFSTVFIRFLLTLQPQHSKICVKQPLSKRQKIGFSLNIFYLINSLIVFKTNYRFMQVKHIAECSMGSILQ